MIRYITIFFLAISLMSCEKEPLSECIIEVQESNLVTIFTQEYSTTYSTSGNIYYEYYSWGSDLMAFYNDQWLATNPSDYSSQAWYDWAIQNTQPTYLIISSDDYSQSADWNGYNQDYYYLNTNISDLITNGDTVIIL